MYTRPLWPTDNRNVIHSFQPQVCWPIDGYVCLTNTTPLTEGVAHKELHPQMAGSLGAVKETQKKVREEDHSVKT